MQIENPWIRELGVYEPGKPIEEVARELGFDSIDDICKLASNENSLGPSPKAVEAVQKAAVRMHLYPDGGSYYLLDALSEHLGVPTSRIAVGNGSNELLELIGHVYLSEGTNIVMADRAFVVYRLVPPVYKAHVKAVPMKDYRHDLDAMLDAIDEKTKIVFIANPNNPTGTYLTQDELERFMERVPDHVAVAFDEAYIELVPEEEQTDTLKFLDRGHVYVSRTFSKAYGLAGLRLGYCVANEECIGLLNRVRQPFNTNILAQEAAIAALADQEHVTKTRRMVMDGYACLTAEFERSGLEYIPSVANFILVKVGSDGREVFEALQRKKVIVRPMNGYQLPEWIRVTIGTPEENRRLIGAMQELMEEGVITS